MLAGGGGRGGGQGETTFTLSSSLAPFLFRTDAPASTTIIQPPHPSHALLVLVLRLLPPPAGMTPILEVFRHQHGLDGEAKKRAMSRLLLDAGANLNLVAPSGFSLLHFAFQVCQEQETLTMLLDAGLNASYNINKPLSSFNFEAGGRTCCLHVATRRGWGALSERLVRAGRCRCCGWRIHALYRLRSASGLWAAAANMAACLPLPACRR